MPDEAYVFSLLDSLVAVGRPKLREVFRLDSCIASSNVVRQVLWHYHVYSEAVPVKTFVLNEKADEFMKAGHPEWVKQRRENAYSVGVGYGHGSDSEGWDGHLVLIVDHAYLLDMSADQMTRPDYGIVVPCFYARLNGVDLTHAKAKIALGLTRGGVLVYEGDPGNQLFRRAPDWTRPYRDVVRTVEEAVRADIERKRGGGVRKDE